MTRLKFAFYLLMILTFLLSSSCGSNEPPNEMEMEMLPESFDRKLMLSDWANDIIVPAFESYMGELSNLVSAKDAFISNPKENQYDALVNAWLGAYKSWQYVSMFDIGKAEEIGLRNFTNIYPTDVDLISSNIQNQNFNLELPSNFDAQGFPALDYLIFGLSNDKSEAISLLSENQTASYLDDLVTRLFELGQLVLSDWQNGFTESFINNDGSSATASMDKLVNDYLFYYERFLRAGKIGIPAGVFSGSPLSGTVEAPYSNIYSKLLFLEGLKAVENFFVGQSFDGLRNGKSVEDYLAFVSAQNQTADIAGDIINQFQSAENSAQGLLDSFQDQIENDNIKLLETYDELQKAVVLLKVDMLQALNIQVDFVDADGD